MTPTPHPPTPRTPTPRGPAPTPEAVTADAPEAVKADAPEAVTAASATSFVTPAGGAATARSGPVDGVGASIHLPEPVVTSDPELEMALGAKAFAGLGALHFGRPVDETQIHRWLEFIDERHDCADFRVLSMLKALYRYRAQLTEPTVAAIRRSILGFKYWMDEPGVDGMCYWSENHQVLFHTCEFLAGQMFPDDIFTNDGRTGRAHMAGARVRLQRWLQHRFTYGFTEWLSNTYYEEDVAALALLIDHAEDDDLVVRATIVLDLLMLDMALHRFDGHFVASAGRAYEGQKKDPARADVNDLLVAAFGEGEMGDLNFERGSATFILSERYHVPPVLRAIAATRRTMRIHTSMGLDADEVVGRIGPRMDVDTTGMFFWLMEAFTTPHSIDVTVEAIDRWNLTGNQFLRPFRYVVNPWLRRLRVLPLLVRALNPATQGITIERANVTTYRTPHFLLSSAQRYHPGQYGDQQHIWTAALPNRVNVFALHPGAPMFDPEARAVVGSYWVGNGKNPHVAQLDDVLLATYNTRGRPGLLEPKRVRATHLYFPVDRFDEIELAPTLLCGRVGDSYIAVRTTSPLTRKDPDDFVQEGVVTHYAVLLSERDRHADFGEFVAWARRTRLTARSRGRRLRLKVDDRTFVLTWKRDLVVNGRPVPAEHPRFDTPFVKAEREPTTLDIAFEGHTLHLDMANGIRRVDLPEDHIDPVHPVVLSWTTTGGDPDREPHP